MPGPFPSPPPLLVLVHGSWLGGWSWRPVQTALAAAGHRSTAPTLTALGDRGHLGGAATGLSDHVADLSGILDFLDDDHIVLAGHSYGGLVAAEVAALKPDRVTGLVVIDGPVAVAGRSMFDLFPAFAAILTPLAVDGLMPPPDATFLGLPPDGPETGRVLSRLRPMPLKTHTEPAGNGAAGLSCPCHFLRFTGFPLLAETAATAAAGGWSVQEIDAGHMGILTHPGAVAGALAGILQASTRPLGESR